MLQLDELRHEASETVQQLLGLIEQVSKISILQKKSSSCAEFISIFPVRWWISLQVSKKGASVQSPVSAWS